MPFGVVVTAAAGAAATGFVPATVTVTDLVTTVSFGPRIVSV
jgi:hypothetical protein